MDLADIDLLDRDAFAQRVPHEWFAFLREHAPVYHHAEPGGPGFWAITRYDDVVALNRDWAANSSDQERGGVVGLEEFEQDADAEEFTQGGKLMLMMDPPDHTRYRKLVNKGFTPRMIGAPESHIRDQAAEIVEKALAAGEVDFVTDVAAELPLEAIAELIGVPLDERHKLFDWSNRMIGSEDPEYAVSQDEAFQAQVEMYMYAHALAEQRRAEPKNDIVSTLLQAEVDGDQLSEMDFNLFFLLLAVAGNETTRNAISHGMLALTNNPDQRKTWLEDFDAVSPTAVEEIVRWATPVINFRRTASRDTVVGGQEVKAGDKVVMFYNSANRDEREFHDPFRFDVTRTPNEHVGFGAGGPHFCLGANLARREIRVLYEEWVKRVPRVEAAGPAERLRSNFINGIKHLPVRVSGLN
jgi:cholest-4-en-3-one 26-monooxygenase